MLQQPLFFRAQGGEVEDRQEVGRDLFYFVAFVRDMYARFQVALNGLLQG